MRKYLEYLLLLATLFYSANIAYAETGAKDESYFKTPLDLNHNGIIDSKEFAPYVYSTWDLNQDGIITEEEWDKVSSRWYGNPTQTKYRNYKYWDTNIDGRITRDEVETNMDTTKLYSAWDTNHDGMIDDSEYTAATFKMHDLDGDGKITSKEWQATK